MLCIGFNEALAARLSLLATSFSVMTLGKMCVVFCVHSNQFSDLYGFNEALSDRLFVLVTSCSVMLLGKMCVVF